MQTMWQRWKNWFKHGQAVYRLHSGSMARIMRTGEHRAMIMFHSVLPQHDHALHLRNTTIDELRTIIRFLQKNGNLVAVQDYIDHPEPHQYAITFDDGLYNNLKYAAPVLAEMGVPASYYLNTPWVEGQSSIWTEELAQWTKTYSGELRAHGRTYHKQAHNRWINTATGQTLMHDLLLLPKDEVISCLCEIQKQTQGLAVHDDYRNLKGEEIRLLSQIPGVTIGSHGVDHHAMTLLSSPHLEDTLKTSKTYLEQCIGQPVVELAFPFGLYNAQVCQTASMAGYEYLIGVEKNPLFSDVPHRFGFYNHLNLPQQLEALSTYQ